MQKEYTLISNIPSIIWGTDSDNIIIAIHGDKSNKSAIPIEMLSGHALAKGYQVLSFDLPEHGDRGDSEIPFKLEPCMNDLATIMQYAKENWKHISLFANSIGAYFGLMTYQNEPLEKVWFLSPLINMQLVIENMMKWFSITAEQLEREKIISTPMGQELDWDYYCFVKEHPILRWSVPTYILQGENDELCEYDVVAQFSEQFSCKLDVVEGAEHYFHTPEQLTEFNKWLEQSIKKNKKQ